MNSLAVLILLFASIVASAQTLSDLDTIRERYVSALLPSNAVEQGRLNAEAIRLAASLAPDGTWPDVDYATPARSLWPAARHLEHTLVLAKSARLLRVSGRPNSALEDKALDSLHLWLDRDPHNPNWWWNEIGVPQLLVEISTLLGPKLTSTDLGRIKPILLRSVWSTWTGANLVWGVDIQIVRGVLYRDAAAVSEAYSRLYQEIRRVPPVEPDGKPGEGIQADNSFHQHGTQFYSGGYGLDYANEVGRFVGFSWGTKLQIPASRMEVFSAFLLDGQQWMIRGGTFDYSATGREITRVGKTAVLSDWTLGPISSLGAAYSLANVVSGLAAEPTPRQPEFRAFAGRLSGAPNARELSGNKQFWTSDYMVHRRPGYMASVRMLSTRTLNGEIINSEGLRSMHISDGVNLLYRTGGEYRDIFPVWNWNLLPGTTALQANLPNGSPDTAEKISVGNRGLTSFVGGASDGQYGAAAMDLERGPLTAKKAWFFFDNLYVALGAGITVTQGTTARVATDINQSLLNGEVHASNSSGPLDRGVHPYKPGELRFAHHDHTGYVLGPNTAATLSNTPQTGRWSEIGTGPSAPVTLPVFNLWIEHGIGPSNASYQYTVLPGATPAETAAESAHPSIQVLANRPEVQAVYVPRLHRASIVFRKAGSIETPLGLIAVDHAAILLIASSANGLTLTAANPENQPIILNVTTSGRRTTFHLPEGDNAGSSVTLASANR